MYSKYIALLLDVQFLRHFFAVYIMLIMLVVVDCFPVSGICCNGQVHTGSSVGFKQTLPCKWTLVHYSLAICSKL